MRGANHPRGGRDEPGVDTSHPTFGLLVLLRDRHAVVTGAATGIGRAVAERLAKEGADVCVSYHTEDQRQAARDLEDRIRAYGSRALSVRVDVRDEAKVRQMMSDAAEHLDGLDLLVNNAGVNAPCPMLDMALAQWNDVLATNLTGTFLCTREACSIMATHYGGVVVNISSVHEHVPWADAAHYCASKAGVRLLMQSAAIELAQHDIRVVNVAPGAIDTPMNAALRQDARLRAAVERQTVLGRIGADHEVAAAVAWVASREAAYVTGATIVVDGGMSLYANYQ